MTLNDKNTRSQKAQILDYMLSGRSISHFDAEEKFNCSRIAARINDLRNDGYDVRTETVKNKASGKRFARYYLPKEEIERIMRERGAA